MGAIERQIGRLGLLRHPLLLLHLPLALGLCSYGRIVHRGADGRHDVAAAEQHLREARRAGRGGQTGRGMLSRLKREADVSR